MTDKLFDGARFGDRFLTKDGQVAIYQSKIECGCSCGTSWSGRTLHNVMTDDRVYSVYDDGKSVMDGKRPMLIQLFRVLLTMKISLMLSLLRNVLLVSQNAPIIIRLRSRTVSRKH